MTSSTHAEERATHDVVNAELRIEQEHVDLVYAELDKASRRATQVERDGLARGRTSRNGDLRDEELTGLFERDALSSTTPRGGGTAWTPSSRGSSSAASTSDASALRHDGRDGETTARSGTSAGSGSATPSTSRSSSTGGPLAASPFYRATRPTRTA